jgi:aspartate/methionine/tyrosine aminotransferase
MPSSYDLTDATSVVPTKSLSPLLTELPDSAVSSIVSRARLQGWTDILPLASGEPAFPFPKSAIQEILNSDDNLVTKYSPFKGYDLLLELIQRKLADINRIQSTQEELIVVPGGSSALYAAVMAVAGRGDEVLISDPCWEHYVNIIRLAGATPVRFRYSFEAGRYTPDLNSLESAITERTKAVLLNTPLNPCGAILMESEARALIDCCERRGIWMIVDEEYETFIYDGHEHFSAGSLSPNVISLYSFSKSFALTGIRLGYVKAPQEIVTLMRRLGLYSYMFPASPSQCMAIGLLKDDYKPYLNEVRALYQQKMSRFHERLSAIDGIECWRPEGGVYLFPRLNVPEGVDPGNDLMERYHLLSVPGEVAGENGVGHIRLFIGLDDDVLDKAAECLSSYMNALG